LLHLVTWSNLLPLCSSDEECDEAEERAMMTVMTMMKTMSKEMAPEY
jgi:hypothetical protein